MIKIISHFLLFIYSSLALSQVPGYYSSIDFNQDGTSIRIQLSELISNTHHTYIPYTSSSTDTWDILRQSDIEYENSTDVLLIYGYDDNDNEFISDRTRDIYDTCHTSWCNGLWNREHVFARSLANPSLTTFEPGPGTDVHNLRAADSQKNTERSNRLFTDSEGDSGIVDHYYYPGDEWKGDIARIIMYMYLRYPGQCEPINSGAGSISYAPNYDMPDVFLEWNQQDPVSDIEVRRNEIISSYQGNRNPFIDNPFIATIIWSGPEAQDTWNLLSGSVNTIEKIVINPTVANDFIEISGFDSNKFKFLIINQLGQILMEINNNKLIDISSLPSGIYVLKLVESNKTLQSKFIVK